MRGHCGGDFKGRHWPMRRCLATYDDDCVKSCKIKGVECLKIQWKLTDDQSSEMDDENLRTVENEERFKTSYPDIVD
ncbi:hypothetical protein TNCV_1049651 [Trichonephila clavipes]|nr:hypothetical protein TNCV_1049651 [Trichonephila clavipes]